MREVASGWRRAKDKSPGQPQPIVMPASDTEAAHPEDPRGLVRIPGGTFTMGCTGEQDGGGDDEKPAHAVTLSDFMLSKHEVTQQLWEEIMGSNPSSFKDCAQCPVEQVSWDDVQDFLKKLNAKYPGKNYRLPTEAEWEYAARGGQKSQKHPYAGAPDVNSLARYANFCDGGNCEYRWKTAGADDGYTNTAPVGSLQPNELGLYDMSGNVWEWCSDWYAADYYKNSPSKNPKGPGSGSYRVCRGGSWFDAPADCRVADRLYDTPDFRSLYLGFRLARTP